MNPMTKFFKRGRLSLEALQDELELVYYGKLVDPKQLEKAEKQIEQEQWEVRLDKDDTKTYFGSIRARKTVEDGKTEYTLTIKALDGDVNAKSEYETPTDQAGFDQIKKIATGGMLKTRFLFPIEGTDYVWEVDAYKNADGTYKPWVKIDLEVETREYQPPAFPIELTDVLDTQPADRSDEQKAFVKKLMDEEFVSPNAYPRKD